MTLCRLIAAACVAALSLPCAGLAQTYPERSGTVVIPFSPGGSNDIMGRYLAQELSKLWGQTFVVENRSGGGTAVGTAHVASSAPDGHTMLFVSTSYTLNAAMRTDLPFDPIEDMIPVAMVATGDVGVVAGAHTDINSVADLVEAAGSREVFYATAGIGSSQHFNGELLADALDIKMTAVPYPGAAEGLVDLLGGRVDLMVGSVGGLLSTVDQGAAMIAVLGDERSAKLPDVPTISEAGFADAQTQFYWNVYAPTGTPEPVLEKLHEAIVSVFNTPEGTALLAGFDARPSALSREEVQAYVIEDVAYWTELATRLNLRN